MQRVPVPSSLCYAIILAALSLLLGGCFNANANVAGPQVLSALPTSWTPLSSQRGVVFSRDSGPIWTEINIDNDATTEYLLYFTYDNGQVGAIIYDQQAGASAVNSPTPLPSPNQPAGQYVSYQVEPSFWTRSDVPDTVGYIAPPGTTIDQLRLAQVERFPAGQGTEAGTANAETVADAPPTNEAIIYGGSTVITVLWWRNTFNGYGVAQMEAGGGLFPEASEGNTPRPLQTVTGQTPLSGLLARSVLCEEVRFSRTDAGEPPDIVQPVYQSAVRYVESSGGIVFCKGAPAYPYYPEGVTLAWLRSAPAGATEAGAPPSDLLWSGLDDARRASLAAMVDLNGPQVAGAPPLIVRDLRTRPTVPIPSDFRSSGGVLTTNVCAEIQSEDGLTLRRLLVDLVYEPLQDVGGVIMPERFAIANISDITGVFANCALIIP